MIPWECITLWLERVRVCPSIGESQAGPVPPSVRFSYPLSLPPSSPIYSPNHTVHQIKENVLLLAEEACQFPPSSPLPHSFPHISFSSLPSLHLKTGEAPDSGPATASTSLSRHRHVSPLLYLKRLRPPNRQSSVYHPTQPNHPERTWYFRSTTSFSSPSYKLSPLKLAPCQRSRFTVIPTAPTASATPHLIAITPPTSSSTTTTTTATACLPMVGTSPESLTSHTYQQECSSPGAVAITISPIRSCPSRDLYCCWRIVPFRRPCA